MSNNRFDYPTATAPTSSLIFDTAGHMVDNPDELKFNDVQWESVGGSDYVREMGENQNRFTFSFIVPRTATGVESDLADAKTFFGVVRRTEVFEWTDEAGTVRTVRNMTNPIRFTPENGIWMKCEVELKQQ